MRRSTPQDPEEEKERELDPNPPREDTVVALPRKPLEATRAEPAVVLADRPLRPRNQGAP